VNSAAPPSLFGITATPRNSAIKIKAKVEELPEFNLIFDTGCPFTLLSERIFRGKEHLYPLKQCQERLKGVGGSLVKVYGTTRLPLKLTMKDKEIKKYMDIIVIAFDHPEAQGLMGRDAMREFKIGMSHQGDLLRETELPVESIMMTHTSKTALEELIETTEHPTVREIIRRNEQTFGENLTELREGSKTMAPRLQLSESDPIYQAPYPIPQKHEEAVRAKIEEMLEAGIIEESISPYNSPLYPVVKQNGEIRITLDLQKINKATILRPYPMPRIDRCIAAMAGAKYFSSLDLSNGYFQIRNNPCDNELLAFTLPFGRFQLKRMAQGAKNSPMAFQKIMHDTLGNLVGNGVQVFIDDVVIYSRTEAEHIQLLEQVFRKLNTANLKLKPSKCRFLTDQVKFLGHEINQEGIAPNRSNTAAMEEAPRPTSVRETRRFLGMIGFFRPFIPQAAKLLSPLFDLLKGKRKFAWTDECQKAFERVKAILTRTPVLAHPDYKQPFLLFTDACDTAVGAYLAQEQHDGTTKPIAFFSKRLTGAPTRYSTVEKEFLAVVWAARHFRYYLVGRETKLYSDHKPITYSKGSAYKNLRLTRWSEELLEYNLIWNHIKGEENVLADYLSRHPRREIETAEVQLVEEPGYLNTLVTEKLWAKVINDIKTKPNRPSQYHIEGNNLMFTDGQGRKRIIVPRSKGRAIIKHYHELPITGHPNVEDTMRMVSERFKWKGMEKEVREVIQICEKCQKANAIIPRAPYLTYKPPTEPFQWISIDLMGPFPPTRQGNSYVFVCLDLMTRFPIIAPMETASAEETARVLMDQVICQFGTPKYLLSDRGTNFTSRLFQKLCGVLGVKHLGTTSFRPQANGQVERLNRSLQEIVRKLATEEEWDEILPRVGFAVRAHKHTSTGVSPFKALYDFEPRIPLPIKEVQSTQTLTTLQAQAEEIATNHVRTFSKTRELVSKTLDKLFEKRKERVTHEKIRTYAPGDLVWVKIMPVRSGPHKFLPRMKGPGVVKEKLCPVTYKVELDGKIDTIHIDRLKQCHQQPRTEGEKDEEMREKQDDDEDTEWWEQWWQNPGPEEQEEGEVMNEDQGWQNPVQVEREEGREQHHMMLRPRNQIQRPARYC